MKHVHHRRGQAPDHLPVELGDEDGLAGICDKAEPRFDLPGGHRIAELVDERGDTCGIGGRRLPDPDLAFAAQWGLSGLAGFQEGAWGWSATRSTKS